ncbi:hypothetical protein F4678DRAFT_480772 [Xylaria arbuscula]|nr:hypothetical protein F4678DRAFT_480772 [Xylaria arbuscula]
MDKAETSKPCSTFHPFPKLPAELRNQIWSYVCDDLLGALDDLKPALYAYQEGCWRGRWLLPGDKNYYTPGQEEYDYELNHMLNFHPDKLHKARVPVPLAIVSRVAHNIVVKWAQQSGFCTYIEEGQFFFLRPFLPDRNTVFLCKSDWYSVALNTWGTVRNPDRSFCIEPGLTRVALPKSLLQLMPPRLGVWPLNMRYWIDTYSTVKDLYIVMDVPSDQDLSREISTPTH